jgi:hypothetical protein
MVRLAIGSRRAGSTQAVGCLHCLCIVIGSTAFTTPPAAAAGDYVVTGVCKDSGVEGLFALGDFGPIGTDGIRAAWL